MDVTAEKSKQVERIEDNDRDISCIACGWLFHAVVTSSVRIFHGEGILMRRVTGYIVANQRGDILKPVETL